MRGQVAEPVGRRDPAIHEEITAISQFVSWSINSNGVAGLRRQPAAGRAQMRAWVVPERLDERVLLERVLHDTALDALTAAVHEPQLAQSLRVRGVHVLLNH